MSKITNEMINEIIIAVGGADNIAQNGNCMTRLRLGLHDQQLADHAKIKQISGVLGVIESDSQLQIILGPGKAQEAKELLAKKLMSGDIPNKPSSTNNIDLADIAEAQKKQMKSKQNAAVQAFFAKFATIFTPLIPGFIAAGLLLGIATLLGENFVKGVEEPNILLVQSISYITIFSKGLFTFLGILVGYNAQQAFGGSGVNGAIIASLFLLTYTATGTVGYYSGIEHFFGFVIDPRGNIVGILIATIVGAYVERFVRRFIPANLDMVLTSTFTLLIMGAVTFLLIMPVGMFLFRGMSYLFVTLNSNPIGAAILAGLFLISVMFGIHQGFVPVYMALVADQGFNSLFPILAMAGAGQVGASLALFVRAQKGSLLRKQVSGAIIPGILGIGEPLIYGVTLPRIKPFITACIGGAVGGFFIGLVAMLGLPMGLNTVFGPSGIIAIPLMTSAHGIMPAIWVYVGGLAISYAAGFALTWLFGTKNVDLS